MGRQCYLPLRMVAWALTSCLHACNCLPTCAHARARAVQVKAESDGAVGVLYRDVLTAGPAITLCAQVGGRWMVAGVSGPVA